MHSRQPSFALACRLVVAALLVSLATAPLAGATPNHPIAPADDAKAFITIDVDTGEVLAGRNARTPMLVASTFKVVTALVVRANVDLTSTVTVSDRAENVPPLKLSIRSGEKWSANALLHAMLIASLNDAAFALAEEAGGGSLEGFEKAVAAHGRRLGFADNPQMHDPAGLDDEFAHGGGNKISARDLSIATRAFLADPLLTSIAAMDKYSFDGGDGEPHRVINHNAFLTIYPGAIGVKTGYTERSGRSLIAAATRQGRTLAVVVIDAEDPVAVATAQLDAGFARPRSAQGTGDVLPPIGIAQTSLKGGQAPSARPTVLTAQVPMPEGSKLRTVTGFAVVSAALVAVAGTVGRRGRQHDSKRASR